MSRSSPKRRPRPQTPSLPCPSPSATADYLRIPLTLPVRRHEPGALERDKAEALARLPPIPEVCEPATPESINLKRKLRTHSEYEAPLGKRSEAPLSENSRNSLELLQTPIFEPNLFERKTFVPGTYEQTDTPEPANSVAHKDLVLGTYEESDSLHPTPVSRKILVPETCEPSDSSEPTLETRKIIIPETGEQTYSLEATPKKRKVVVPETCDQMHSPEATPEAGKVLVPDSCPTDEDDEKNINYTNICTENSKTPGVKSSVLVPETPDTTQRTQIPMTSIPLRFPLKPTQSRKSSFEDRSAPVLLRLPTQSRLRPNKPMSIPLKLPTQFSRQENETMLIPLRLPMKRSQCDNISLSIPLRLPTKYSRRDERPGSILLKMPIQFSRRAKRSMLIPLKLRLIPPRNQSEPIPPSPPESFSSKIACVNNEVVRVAKSISDGTPKEKYQHANLSPSLRSKLPTPCVVVNTAVGNVTEVVAEITPKGGDEKGHQIRHTLFTSARRVADQEFGAQFTTGQGKPVPVRRPSDSGCDLSAKNFGVEELDFTSGGGKPVPVPKFATNFTTGNGRNVKVPELGGFTSGNGRAIPVVELGGFSTGSGKQVMNPLSDFKTGNGKKVETPLGGFTTGNGKQLKTPLGGFMTGNGAMVPAPDFGGFSTGTGKEVKTPFNNTGMIAPDLDAIFANAKKLTAHKNFREPLFTTLKRKAVRKSKFETPASNDATRLLKTPGTSGGRLNYSMVKALPFNTLTSPRQPGHTTEKGVTFRNLPPKTPGANRLSSRRQLFQTPVKAKRGHGGLKSTPFKRPRRVTPVNPRSAKNNHSPSVKTTKDLNLFFPKDEVPSLSMCGKLVILGMAYPSENIVLPEVEIADPADGAKFVFLKSRFGPWNVLPENVKTFINFAEINTFCVDDCVALLTHVFPASEKKPATRIGSRDWTTMSYGLAVWKLAKLESEKAKVFLTVANLLREIWRRVDREWHKNQAPHLAQMLRRDSSPRSHVVLMICGVRIGDGGNLVLEVTDGWYICRMRACRLLTRRVNSRLLNVGDKIHVFECELVPCNNEPFFFGDGDEMGANALAPAGNCVKKVRAQTTSRLGIRKGPLYTRSGCGFRPDGGKVPGAQVTVLRSYPPFFIENSTGQDGDSHSVFRKREAEEVAQLKFETKLAARVADEDREPNIDEVMERRNVSMAIDFTVCGVADDPHELRNRKLIRIYRPSEDVARLIAKEGSVLQLPPMKRSGRNWVTLSLAVRPVNVLSKHKVPHVTRTVHLVQQLAAQEVENGSDFDGVYVVLHVTEVAATGARFAYFVDECCLEEKRFLVVEMRGTDATCLPRALTKCIYNVVALRDLEISGVDARLGVVHARVTLRTQILSAASTRKRRWPYLIGRLSKLEKFVTPNRSRLELVREAIIAFANGDSSQIRVS